MTAGPGSQTAARGLFGRVPRQPAPAPVDPATVLACETSSEWGLVLGWRLGGEPALPARGQAVVLSPGRMARHVLVMGATGSGKTETALRLAYAVACETDAPVFYVDGKGDRLTAQRFLGLMRLAGRGCRVFPMAPVDGWRGAAHEVCGRLMEIIDYSAEGPASWYRDVAKTALHLACDHPDGPPRSSEQLLARLNLGALVTAHRGSSAAGALTKDLVRQVRLRYEAFFAQARGALDGTWAWEDTPSAYLLLDTLALKEEASSLARFLFEDFCHYFTTRKPHDRFCVLIVDEFSALTGSGSMAARVEQARGFHTSLVLCPQVSAGMGDETETQRILGSVETVICHRVNTPEDIIALAGTRQRLERSSQFADGIATGGGSARLQHQYKIDPNRVRGLAPGMAYVIARGKAMKVRIAQAPQVSVPLPAPRSEKKRGGQTAPALDKKANPQPAANDLPY